MSDYCQNGWSSKDNISTNFIFFWSHLSSNFLVLLPLTHWIIGFTFSYPFLGKTSNDRANSKVEESKHLIPYLQLPLHICRHLWWICRSLDLWLWQPTGWGYNAEGRSSSREGGWWAGGVSTFDVEISLNLLPPLHLLPDDDFVRRERDFWSLSVSPVHLVCNGKTIHVWCSAYQLLNLPEIHKSITDKCRLG